MKDSKIPQKELREIQKIILVNDLLKTMDVNFWKKIAESGRKRANTNDSALPITMALNPGFLMEENDRLRLQAESMAKLCEYTEMLKEIDNLTEKIAKQKKTN